MSVKQRECKANFSMAYNSVVIPPPRNGNPVVFGRDFAEQNITLLIVILLAPVVRRLV